MKNLLVILCVGLMFNLKPQIISKSSKDIISVGIWEDKDAEYRESLTRKAVKFQTDIKVIADEEDAKELEIDSATAGSGVVINISKENNLSLVMTAQHVCEENFKVGNQVGFFGQYTVTYTKSFIVTREMKHVDYKVIYEDKENDVCVVEAEAIVGEPAELAALYPEPQAMIHTAGAPAGYWNGLANVVEGNFGGEVAEKICLGDDQCFEDFVQFSIPIVGGMSGSAVYYKGKLISLVTLGTSRYPHIGWGPGLASLRKAVNKASEYWRKK